MIDTNELRSMVNGAQFEGFANSVIHSLLDRLEAAEKERDAAELMSLALRAKIEQMEQQGPVSDRLAGLEALGWNDCGVKMLNAAPETQGLPKC